MIYLYVYPSPTNHPTQLTPCSVEDILTDDIVSISKNKPFGTQQLPSHGMMKRIVSNGRGVSTRFRGVPPNYTIVLPQGSLPCHGK